MNIDVIIGGHGKTIGLEPLVTRNSKDEEIFVSQSGWNGLMVRKLSFTFNNNSKCRFDVNNFIPGLSDEKNLYKEFKNMIA